MTIHEKLQNSQILTLPYFDLSESELSKTYAEDKWSVRYLLHHIVDAETVLYDRVRRVISKPNQVIWAFDQDAWSKGLEYDKMPLQINKNIYIAVRASVIHLASQYYNSLGNHSFVHSQTGSRTLRDEFDKIAWHNEHHLQQIQAALKTEL